VTAFDQARLVEARSLAILEPLIVERHGRFVLTGKGRLSAFLQRELGDLMFNGPDGRLWSVEVKAEQRFTGNLFLETWSNRNLADAFSHAERGCKVGWLVECRADLLFYHFLDVDRLYVLELFALKRWAFTDPSQRLRVAGGSDLVGRIYDFPEKAQAKYDQRNETCGRIVPLAALEREMVPAPKLLHPRQLLLDLGMAA
jgi:hypothetical protein